MADKTAVIGKKVPDFSLPATGGKAWKLSAAAGRKLVLYFYPKDSTPGCTLQACGLQSDLEQFNNLSIRVLGVSMDSVASHKKFADKYGLRFSLLADTERKLIEAYGVWVEKSMYGKSYMGISRSSFLVGANGKIEQVWEKANTKTHAQDVLAFVNGGAAPAAAKAPAKKAAAKPAPSKKAAVKKAAAKKAAVKTAPAKKAVAKKSAAKTK